MAIRASTGVPEGSFCFAPAVFGLRQRVVFDSPALSGGQRGGLLVDSGYVDRNARAHGCGEGGR